MTQEQPLDLTELLRSRLEPGESVVWHGSPDAGAIAQRAFPMAIAGIVGVTVIFLWVAAVANALHNHADNAGSMALTLLFAGFPATIFSIVLVFAPTSARTRAARTLYAVTDRRAIVMRGPGEMGMESFEAADIADVSVKSPNRPVSDVAFGVAPHSAKGEGRVVVLQALADPSAVADRLAALGRAE